MLTNTSINCNHVSTIFIVSPSRPLTPPPPTHTHPCLGALLLHGAHTAVKSTYLLLSCLLTAPLLCLFFLFLNTLSVHLTVFSFIVSQSSWVHPALLLTDCGAACQCRHLHPSLVPGPHGWTKQLVIGVAWIGGRSPPVLSEDTFICANEQSGFSPVSTSEADQPASWARFLTILTFDYPINNAYLFIPEVELQTTFHRLDSVWGVSRKSWTDAPVVLLFARVANETACLICATCVEVEAKWSCEQGETDWVATAGNSQWN